MDDQRQLPLRLVGNLMASRAVSRVKPSGHDEWLSTCAQCGCRWWDSEDERHDPGCAVGVWRLLTVPDQGAMSTDPCAERNRDVT